MQRQQRRGDLVASKGKHYQATVRDEHGGVRSPALDKHVAGKEKEDAKKLKTEIAFAGAQKAARRTAVAPSQFTTLLEPKWLEPRRLRQI